MYSGAENRPMGSQGFGAENQWENDFSYGHSTSPEGVFAVSFGPMVAEACNCLVSGQQMSKVKMSSTAPFLLCPLSPLHCRSCLPHLGH
ncbi:hypothetical protein TNCT_447691 [Trichonephila clavata]|uniref:Uncharacterized protein n=1 Tax=Trichonephila clavata TaxID=2740835 RepID=A0A8X6LY87_TRICU|nr:hypothetical protein TNCT_447691 [Trichonephila clavata]